MLGGLALGAALLVLVARSLLADEPVAPVSTGLLAASGCFFWLVGVYQKETSLCAVPLLAAAVWVERARLSRWRLLHPSRRRALVGLGLVIVLPLLHVAVVTARIALRGDLVVLERLAVGDVGGGDPEGRGRGKQVVGVRAGVGPAQVGGLVRDQAMTADLDLLSDAQGASSDDDFPGLRGGWRALGHAPIIE